MKLPALTVVPAGAGSGKTYKIQHQLGEWVEAGLVAPDRIVAVTFTEAAASELRDRIRKRLLELNRQEDALRLDQAYISTIHGFGLRLLTEFAFEGGQSPVPRLLSEDEQDILIRQALARTQKAEVVLADLSAFGYRYDFISGRSAAEVFRRHVLEVVALLRSIGWRSEEPRYLEQARAWIEKHYGAFGDGKQVTAALRSRVTALLKAYPDSLEGRYGAGIAAASKDFRDNYRYLRQARGAGELESNWGLWQKLRKLRTSNRSCALPDDYDALATAVMAAADALVTHPGPLAHAQAHIDALLGAGQEVLQHYAEAKRQAGLVDYTDMIALADQLLNDRPAVLAELVNRIDCLVVDEFQDTNPLQFALLWQLKQAGVPTLIVGDLKQAIMGFQGADPRLFGALIAAHRKRLAPLTENWRSQPPLMETINAVGAALFGADYDALTPMGAPSHLAPLEAVCFADKFKRGDEHFVRAAWVGERLKELLVDSSQVVIDRRTQHARPMRGRDIAILCQRHKILEKYAQVLRAQGLRVRLSEGGWFQSRCVQLAWYGLSYVANPADKHAALYLAVTELGRSTLEAGLKQLIQQGRVTDPLLERLDVVADSGTDRTVYALVCDVVRAMSLYDEVAGWPDGVQARANLLRLEAEAGEFMNANREARASGGFYGDGLATFQAWLAAKVDNSDKDKQPAPRVLDEDAIELVTWHAAKGREWPVVVVGELDRVVKPQLPAFNVGYEDFGDLDRLLERAQVEFSPQFDAPESTDKFASLLQQAAEVETRRLLYVALTRPREKLILEWPSYLDGKDAVTPWSILTTVGITMTDNQLAVGAACFDLQVARGAADLPDDLDLQAAAVTVDMSTIGRGAIERRALPTVLTPDSVSPSTLDTTPAKPGPLTSEAYAQPLLIDSTLPSIELGTCLHRYFEVLGARPEALDALVTITCSEAFPAANAQAVARQVALFEGWLQSHFGPVAVYRELPILCLTQDQSVMSGIIDLVVETAHGVWVIDHKSDQVEDAVAGYGTYRIQLEAYADALRQQGKTVLGTGVHWIRRGELVLESVQRKASHSGGAE